MYFTQQRLEPVTEGIITFAASETSQSRKLTERQSAIGTSQIGLGNRFGAFARFLFGHHAGKKIRQREGGIVQRRMETAFGGAFLAQIEDNLLVIDDLGYLNA
jgi:hypothetical protein